MRRNFPRVRTQPVRTGLVVVLIAAALVASPLVRPSTAASDHHSHLTHRRHQIAVRINQGHRDLDGISRRLLLANRRLHAGQARLRSARSRLQGVRAAVAAATAYDAQMQQRLDEAVQRLRNAQLAQRVGRANLARAHTALVTYAVSSYQVGGPGMTSLSLAFGSDSPQQVVDGLQAVDSVLDKQEATLQQLAAYQVLLRLTEQRIEQAAHRVQSARLAAARSLRTKRELEARAAAAATGVAQQVRSLRADRHGYVVAKRQQLARMAAMRKEQRKVAAALRRIAERRARERAAARRAAARRVILSHTDRGGGYLSYPSTIHTITSGYGMRLDPVIHVYQLHDGTDFGLPCGTPVYAAAPGRVSQEYYSGGYGNRVFIDHGVVHGVSLWTSYNHLSRFVAHVGEQVARGQLIAYSGTTGWSTGCHLHFSVYVNGATVNPLGWL
ncbi:MAG TPA: M23 family metallopeptidase [Nocardioidaceae bacterium]|nr:M23 family metallopeptidase [Nocardioidaceae bacterium]